MIQINKHNNGNTPQMNNSIVFLSESLYILKFK